MIPVLQERYANSKIIVLHVSDYFPAKDVPTLHGTDSVSIQNFLEREVPEIEAFRIRIIEWRPSMNYYKEDYVKILSQVVEFIKRADAEKRTVTVFGKRWIKNFFKNIKNLNNTVLYKITDIPVIVTGSGPGLEAALPAIKKMQNNCLIIASSSSVMALAHFGIRADLIIATDGGSWALQHIYPCFRNKTCAPLAVNLCAALPSQCAAVPHLLINDGSMWQNIILHELSLPSVVISQKGTVTASAVELALILSCGNIYLAGMDLSVKDIRTHARPYSFDYLFFSKASRLMPVYSQSFVRSSLIRDGGSLDIYAAWFKNQLNLWPKRIFSLAGNHEIFENTFPSISNTKNTDELFKTVIVKEDPALFGKRGALTLISALKDNKYSAGLKAELTPLLFPDRKDATEQELENEITGIL